MRGDASMKKQRFDKGPFLAALLGGMLALTAFSGCSTENSAAEGSGKETEIRQTWEATYIRGVKVGHLHTRTTHLTEDGRKLVKITGQQSLTMNRGGRRATQKVSLTSVETPSGQIVRFESSMTAGETPIVTTGRLVGDELLLQTATKGLTKSSRIPWKTEWGGFFAVEASLEAKPMKPGQRRTIRRLEPIFNQCVAVTLAAVDYESTSLLDGERELLKINHTANMGGGQKIETVLWTDRTGIVHKSVAAVLDMASYRTTKEIAESKSGEAPLELFDLAIVKVERRLTRPHDRRRVVYRARIKDGDPAAVFVACPSQSVKSIDGNTAQITVRAIRPDRPKQLDAQKPDKPTEKDLAPNNLIESNDRRVIEMANKVAPKETDPWRLAVALESHVNRSIREVDFSQVFATAADVAENLKGDCSEHAVLLAALCRARKIPARVAVGLVYFAPEGGFAYHMWTEVWIRDRWVPLDATLARGGIGAGHLKLAQSNFHGASAHSMLLPVIQVLGRLELEIVEVE